jgi:hypothetical protein
MTIPVTTGSLGLLLSDPGGPDHHKPRGWSADLDTNLQAIDTAISGLGGIQIAKVSLTSGNILNPAAGDALPILVPAPGAGKMILPVSAAWKYKFVTTPYTISTGSPPYILSVAYPSGSTESLAILGTLQAGLIDQSADTVASSFDMNTLNVIFSSGASGNAFARTSVENVALVFDTSVPYATLGDGTLEVTIAYYIVDLS